MMEVRTTDRDSKCEVCNDTIEAGTPKIVYEGWKQYASAHLDCLGVEQKNDSR